MKTKIKLTLRHSVKSAITGIEIPAGKKLDGYLENSEYFVWVPGKKYSSVQVLKDNIVLPVS